MVDQDTVSLGLRTWDPSPVCATWSWLSHLGSSVLERPVFEQDAALTGTGTHLQRCPLTPGTALHFAPRANQRFESRRSCQSGEKLGRLFVGRAGAALREQLLALGDHVGGHTMACSLGVASDMFVSRLSQVAGPA